MTKIITRYFASAAAAQAAEFELVERRGFSPDIVGYFDRADGLAEQLSAANVDTDAAKSYEKHMAKGGAVILVCAGFRPLGVAKTARAELARFGAEDLSPMVEEVDVKDERRPGRSVMDHHPHMLKRQRSRFANSYHMADWPIRLISRRKPWSPSPFFGRHDRMADFPVPLLSGRKPFTGSIFPPHARMANFPIGLISKRKPITASIFPRHARMANFPIGLISRRKPFTGTAIGRHTRMANWPFPHLINGKASNNALVPGGARMANFPIPLISKRKPNTASIIAPHARMANFPIGLISKRKPFTGSIFPRHARMANVILPLTVRESQVKSPERKGFTISKMFGLPTVISR